MSRPLVRAKRIVDSRVLRLQIKLNDELGFRDRRLRFTEIPMRSGPTTWELRNTHIDAGAALPAGCISELAHANRDDSRLFFGYNETWQLGGARDRIEFVSSNLRFVIAAGVENVPELCFRLEWAGAKTEGGAIIYPGVGAAHPHWQFDVDANWTEPATHGLAEPIDVDLELAPEEIDLETGVDPAVPRPLQRINSTLAAFHRLHLPARTLWHDLLCSMPDVATPQQHTPASEDEIDRWVISALRYLKAEFERYT